MPYIRFAPYGDVNISIEQHSLSGFSEHISFGIKLFKNLGWPEDNIELTSQESFESLAGSLMLYRISEKKSVEADNITINQGLLCYTPKVDGSDYSFDSGYEIEFGLEDSQYERILHLIQNSYFPRQIIIKAQGLKYGSSPSAKDKKWDNLNNPTMKIDEMSFLFPITQSDYNTKDSDLIEEVIDTENTSNHMLTSNILSKMDHLLLVFLSIKKSLNMLVVLLIILLIGFWIKA